MPNVTTITSVGSGYVMPHVMQSIATNFQFENSYNIFSGILYKFLIDRDSCSDIVGYFYDVAPG